jgi:hypothetical protein
MIAFDYYAVKRIQPSKLFGVVYYLQSDSLIFVLEEDFFTDWIVIHCHPKSIGCDTLESST